MFGPLMAPGASLRRLLLAFMGLVAASRHPVHIYFAGAGPTAKIKRFSRKNQARLKALERAMDYTPRHEPDRPAHKNNGGRPICGPL